MDCFATLECANTQPSGGMGALTPDSFPVFDTFCENAQLVELQFTRSLRVRRHQVAVARRARMWAVSTNA
jgi:hypothetical protein